MSIKVTWYSVDKRLDPPTSLFERTLCKLVFNIVNQTIEKDKLLNAIQSN